MGGIPSSIWTCAWQDSQEKGKGTEKNIPKSDETLNILVHIQEAHQL